jgi:hypothetical protein
MHEFGQKPTGLYFFVFGFFDQTKVFSSPLDHAEEEFYGPGPPSSRNRSIRIFGALIFGSLRNVFKYFKHLIIF